VLNLSIDESTELEQDWDSIYAQEEVWYKAELARANKQ